MEINKNISLKEETDHILSLRLQKEEDQKKIFPFRNFNFDEDDIIDINYENKYHIFILIDYTIILIIIELDL